MRRPYLVVGLLVAAVLVIILSSNLFVYYSLSKDFDARMSDLSAQVNSSSKALEEQILMESKYSEREREELLALLVETSEVFSTEIITLENELSRTQTESRQQIASISEELEERSQELESRIAQVDVTSSDFTAIIDEIRDAVVSIRTNVGQGSGFFFDSRGYVMTNRHVIDGASWIAVVDADGIAYPASLVGTAVTADLAVLYVNASHNFEALEFGSSPRVGSRVIAVGNPLGLSFTVTEGIVSATDRVVDSSGVGYVQTDVPINRGNSGGPLVDAQGRVVGINTFKLVDSEGLGFAIPADIAEDIADQAVS